jgi:hypothetical protein
MDKLEGCKIAYVVGVDKNNELFFEVSGENIELLQLLGLHQFAGDKISAVKNDRFMAGDRLTHEVGKAVSFLNEKMGELLKINGEGFKTIAKIVDTFAFLEKDKKG